MLVFKTWVAVFCMCSNLNGAVVFCEGNGKDTTKVNKDINNNPDDTSPQFCPNDHDFNSVVQHLDTCTIEPSTFPKAASTALPTLSVKSTTITPTPTTTTEEVYSSDTIETTKTISTITISTSSLITSTDTMTITMETTIPPIADQSEIDPSNKAIGTTRTSTETEFSTLESVPSIEPTKTITIAIEDFPTATVLSAVTPRTATATMSTILSSTEPIIKTVPPELIPATSSYIEDSDSIEPTPELISTVVSITVPKQTVLPVTEHARIAPTSTSNYRQTHYDIVKTAPVPTISVADTMVLNEPFEQNDSSAVVLSTNTTTPTLPSNTSTVLYL